MLGVFDLYPVGRDARAIRAIVALRDQALQSQHAGMTKEVWPNLATLKIGREYPVDATGQQSREARLSHAQWKLSQIVAVAHQHIEGVKLHLVIVLAAVQPIEVRSAVDAKQHGFTVEDKRADADAKRCLNDQRIAIRPVITIARKQANSLAVPMNGKAIAIVFDFVDPIWPRRHGSSAGRQTRGKLYSTHGG